MPIVPEEDELVMDANFDDFINWDKAEPTLANVSSSMDFMPTTADATLGQFNGLDLDPPFLNFSHLGADNNILLDNELLEPSLGQPNLDFRDHFTDPCLHCRANGYDCKMICEGTHKNCCTSCIAFRVNCSHKAEGAFSGGTESATPETPESKADAIGRSTGSGSAKTATRLSKDSVKVLKSWFANHSKHPYPTEEEKESLQRLTQLTKVQITNWLANYRRRNKFARPRSTSPSVRNLSLGGMDIPQRRATPAPMDRRLRPSHYENMNPLERWKNSPPENEPASVNDIARAVSSASTAVSSGFETPRSFNLTDDSRSLGHGSSVSSLGTSRTSQSSAAGSFASAYSHGSRNSFGSFNSLDRGRRRRRRRALPNMSSQPTRSSLTQPTNMYQCTFCPQTFKAKYDWQRHEKSLHISLESWVCAPKGAKAFNPETSRIECVFCSEPNPTQDHLETHNYSVCQEKGVSERTFYRKDHLRQHLRLVHNTKFMNWAMSKWEQKHDELESICGFCGLRMTTWTARVEHLAGHFKAGSSMAEWKGDWGFSPFVLDKVQNAIPPYMIHEERISPWPYVASHPMPETPIHAYELLKTELVYWTQTSREQNSTVTDDELVHEACRVIYGAEVLSHKGIASAPSWLRDVLMSNETIAQRARHSPIRSGADSHVSILKINGKDNIFEACPLEHKLLEYVNSRTLLGLTPTDGELQLECCKILGHFEETSSSPSDLVGNLLVRLVMGSKSWLADFRLRARLPRSEDMIDEDRRPTDGKSLDSSIHNFSRLERELAQHVRSQRAKGIEPDGPDLQRAARIIIYGNDDGWNQTAADSPEWLGAFGERMQEAGSRAVLKLDDPLHHLFDPDAELIALQNAFASQQSSKDSPTTAITTSESAPNVSSPVGRCARSVPFFIHDLNCYKRLKKELARWSASVMSPNNPNQHVPSDAELQHQARWILYDDDDPWNVTAADNFEWLQRFKRDHKIISDDSGPGLPDSVGWNLHQGGTGFAPPYAYPAVAIEGTGGCGSGEGTVEIPVSVDAKLFQADQRAVDSYLQGFKARYPRPPAVFCSRELEGGLTEFMESQQVTMGAPPSDEMLRAKAREILGTETTAADDSVLLERFKAVFQPNNAVINTSEAEVDFSLMSGMQLPLPEVGAAFAMQAAETTNNGFDGSMMYGFGIQGTMDLVQSPSQLFDM
ncbi:hypothetical protein MGG_01730 [Pyricularia oryzae 70-15]|uniref:Homeobox and C2H2 transcription factor n=3 Tax=Pyricularia oryzae TaxID=318829 RepID=G4MV99_PYRO7|nr:uncharacterized protein MGG_01730 [Pyricularia oryzae 70-15]EHA54921.1 hypothetical protein MGG_01730 [Pyricularia oryzae 70-15]ELQ40487.1 hypothetical protein OOU_Y34scaffold00433g31 [Pyricularia oryzae Y34]KAI7912961.1 hypothetical protein M9X92_009737 [Pyricularia oryzae]KAI7914468.1 hypothetical protein M0657_009472 [Pyricularia oryzae]